MSWKDRLVGALYNPNPGESEETVETMAPARRTRRTSSAAGATSRVSVSSAPSASAQASVDGVDQEFYEDIREELDKAPTPEFNDFLGSLKDLAEDIPDEEKRIRTALKLVGRSGVTKTQLVAAAQTRIDIVRRELNEFEAAIGQQAEVRKSEMASQVETMNGDLQAKSSEINELESRLAALRSEISTITTKRDRIATEMTNIDVRRDEKTAQFLTAHDAHLRELSSVKEKLQNQRG